MYQRREQAALLALLKGKADTEAEAWANLQKITQTSPWAGERSPEDIESSWLKWESKGKQVRLGGGPRGREGPSAVTPEASLLPLTPAGEQHCGSGIQAQGAVTESRPPVRQRAVRLDEVPGEAWWGLPSAGPEPLGIPSPSTATLEPTGPPSGGEGSIGPLTEFWHEASQVGVFAKALVEAMDMGFLFEDTPHRACGSRFSVDLGLFFFFS